MSQRAWCVCLAVTCALALTRVRRRALGQALVCLALLLALGAPGDQSAHAAPSAALVVNDLGDNTTGGNGQCTLREAMTNANANGDTTSGDCVAGSGADTISFSLSGTIVLSATLGTLPAINDDLTVDGSGQSITISGNHAVRVMVVNGGKTLSLNALTIANGSCLVCNGGGIYNSGTLNVTSSTFSGNAA